MVKLPLLLLLIVCPIWLVAQTPPAPTPAPTAAPIVMREPETPEQHSARMAWWREAKFGMFIHWGLYAIPADGEWHMRAKQMPLAEYKKYAEQFNPTQFNADQWAGIARDAGMKYLVLTTKHHDGFAMFHSKASDYNITEATPFKRDPLKELSEACPKYGIKLGTYYSVIADWGHPGGGAGCPKWDKAQEGSLDDYINTISVPQVKELLTHYGPIAVMWFDSDGAQAGTLERASRYAPILKLQPNLIVDPRLNGYPGDFETCEGHIPMQPPAGDWELCTRTNGSWGYTGAPARKQADLLPELVQAWGKGGNVLLNVGPTKEGLIPADSVARLAAIGAWLKINGEAVYGSTRGPFDYLPWGWATRKEGMLYLFVLNWPKDGKLKLPMTTRVERAWLLADAKQTVACKQSGNLTLLSLPAQSPDPDVSVIAVKVDGEIPVTKSLLLHCPITGSENQKGAESLVGPNGGDWRIPSQTGSLQVDLGKPQTFSVMRLTTPYTNPAKVTLEVKVGESWNTVYSEENLKGSEWIKTFPPVSGQVVKLTVTGDKPAIRVGVFELFPPL